MGAKPHTKPKNLIAIVLGLAFCGSRALHATLAWTNAQGGNWSDSSNWSPNQAPGASDDAVITNSGSFTVALDVSATVNSLNLGGNSGQQT